MSSALRRHAVWTVVDQALSSSSNILMAVVAARISSPEDFGAFAVAMVVYGFALVILRGLTGDVLLMHANSPGKASARDAVSTAIAFGLVAAIVVAGAALFVPHTFVPVMSVLAISMLPLAVQDAQRYVCFARQRGDLAVVLDGTWTGVQFTGIFALATVSHLDLQGVMATWGVGAAVSAILGFILLRLRPDVRGAVRWWVRHRHTFLPLVGEYATLRGSGQLALLAVGAVVSLTSFAYLRGCAILFGPLNVLSVSATSILIPEAARREATGRITGLVAGATAGLAALTAAVSGVLYLLPPAYGRAILGSTWRGAHSLIVPMGVFTAAATMQAGPIIALRARLQVRRTLNARLALAPLRVGFGVVGGYLWGVRGAAWGLALAELAGLLLLFAQYAQSERQPLGWESHAVRA